MSKGDKIVLLGLGLAGWYGEGIDARGNTFSTTHYTKDLRWVLRDRDGNPAMEHAGAVVCDKSALLEESPGLVVRSPMLNVRLPPDGRDEFGLYQATAARMLPGLSGGFETLAALAVTLSSGSDAEPGGFDFVGLEAYIHWWMRHDPERLIRWGVVGDDLVVRWLPAEELGKTS